MKKTPFVVLTIVLILAAAMSCAARDFRQIEEILARIDGKERPDLSDMSAVLTLIVEDPEKGIEKYVVRQFSRIEGDDISFLLLVQEPATLKGQGYLKEGDSLWIYDPSSRKFSHMSSKETFQDSEIRVGDFEQHTLAANYAVEDYEEGILGNFAVHIVSLRGTNDTLPFPYIKLWITKDSELILKREDYSLSRRLLRTGLFPKYAQVGEAVLAVQQIYLDELVEGQKTQLTYDEISTNEIPDHVFTKAYVERVSR